MKSISFHIFRLFIHSNCRRQINKRFLIFNFDQGIIGAVFLSDTILCTYHGCNVGFHFR